MTYKVEEIRVQDNQVAILLSEKDESGNLVDGFAVWMDVDKYNSLTVDELKAILADEVNKRRSLLQELQTKIEQEQSLIADKSIIGQEIA